jgi:hypothetical protein
MCWEINGGTGAGFSKHHAGEGRRFRAVNFGIYFSTGKIKSCLL